MEFPGLGNGANTLPNQMERMDTIMCNVSYGLDTSKRIIHTALQAPKILHQGDLLSPFLFNLVVEALNLIILKATNIGLWEGVEVCKNGPKLTHLQYAYNTIMFCPPSQTHLAIIKRALILFQLAFGLQFNFHESSIIGLDIDEPWMQTTTQTLWCKTGSLSFTYLGLPVGGNGFRLAHWEPIFDRMRNKLSTWKGSLLSIGGRLTLIKTSLSNLPLYYMSIFHVLVGVIKEITKLQCQFLERVSRQKKYMAPVSWSRVQSPHAYGGINTGNPLHKNLGLLFKWLWRYLTEPDSLWRNIIQIKYTYNSCTTARDFKIPIHGGPWKAICSTLLRHPRAQEAIS
ncbi:uncharacterized protein [Spinacia oleracea]|uniref:Reverse transcriptase domain-containing protein n=1 Tax=Spinacia oleracea TaxID=3562 RepID=A0ABM3QPQ2_SPIOL|nr:uncharacterized protein LOC130461316 [Spinacia oleracea]